MNISKNNIEDKLVNHNIDLNSINAIQLITFIMEEIESLSHLKGDEKKKLVINLLNEFIKDDDNIFIKGNNPTIIISITTLLESQIVFDIIDTIVACASGALKINEKIKSSCFCFSKK